MMRTRRTRTAALTAAGAAVLGLVLPVALPGSAAGSPAVPAGAASPKAVSVPQVADPPVTNLPDLGYPYMLPQDPYYPTSVAELKNSPTPACPAPTLPPPTNAGTANGYTIPVLIKLSDGVVLGAYSDIAYRWGQSVPFSIIMSGLTGWVIARVSLPSLKMQVDPADVHICDGASTKAFQGFPLSAIEPDWTGQTFTQPDGTEYIPYPGSLALRLTSLDGLKLVNAVVHSVKASLSGVAPDKSLRLSTELNQTMTTQPKPICNPFTGKCTPNLVFTCPVTVSGSFSTDDKPTVKVKAPVIPLPDGTTYTPAVPDPQRLDYLPSRTLTGAVVGGTATVGSNLFDTQIPRVKGYTNRCGTELNKNFYGYGLDGANWYESDSIAPPEGFPIVPGLLNLSLKMTIVQVGMPTGMPTGYGFR